MIDYQEFLRTKDDADERVGFKPIFMPDVAFDFQKYLCDWNIRKGRSATFADCGLGKTLMELIWGENVVRKTNRPVLLLTPLAVSAQTIQEAEKFGIAAKRIQQGKSVKKVVCVTNYERLHHCDPADYAGVVCDESSILKNYDGKLRRRITDFMSQIPYRLLATATPAPNDFMELGTSSEALSIMPHAQMLGMFFTNDAETTSQWNLKPHGRKRFWRWMATWSRAIRSPADLGFDASRFILPKLLMEQHTLKSQRPTNGQFRRPARTLQEQKHERKATIKERCEMVASIISDDQPVVSWCHMNAEGDLLTSLIKGAVQISGKDSDESKEEKLIAFSAGQIQRLVTKPSIASFGLNWQHCAEMTFFPSHSFEEFYQAVRRCLRFGQKRDVRCRIVTTQAESAVMRNLQRKERNADDMFRGMVLEMKAFQEQKPIIEKMKERMELPSWLTTN